MEGRLTSLDVSRLPQPDAIADATFSVAYDQFIERFLAEWTARRAADPSLPMFDVERLRSDPAAVLARAYAYTRTMDRTALNDAVRALLAHLSTGADLDNLAATRGLARLVLAPATAGSPAVMESDARLLDRYLSSFQRESAGSRGLYRLLAMTAWPACHDVAVIGRAVHGRRGDVDVVLAGPGGRTPMPEEIALVRAAIDAPGVRPEATAVTILPAQIFAFDVAVAIRLPPGPEPSLVVAEVESRIIAMAAERLRIGAQIPRGAVEGAAYGPSVEFVSLSAPPADIAPEPYTIPVLGAVSITWQVRS
jgi:phage-related baseplate assembly protein